MYHKCTLKFKDQKNCLKVSQIENVIIFVEDETYDVEDSK